MPNEQQRYNDPEAMLRLAFEGLMAGVWTAMPGIIVDYDATKLTATVQLAIKGVVRYPDMKRPDGVKLDGKLHAVDIKPLPDVPVVFPRGGSATLTFPVTAGDECLVVFASRCIDSFWEDGGYKNKPLSPRQHSLSDGFAILGPFSQKQKISDVSTSEVQLRSNDGETYVSLDPAGQIVKIVAPGGIQITGDVTITGDVSVTGDETVTGTITGQTDVLAGSSNISGKSHLHSGVQSGGSNTGAPVA